MALGLAGKVVLTTGASEGTGKATALSFAREDARNFTKPLATEPGRQNIRVNDLTPGMTHSGVVRAR